MPKYSQANRLLAVTTPLGTDVLLLQQFSGEEVISRLFRFELELLAESTATIAFDAILGQGVTVTLVMPDGTQRYFNGIVSRFSQGQRIASAQGGGTFTRYRAEVVPQLWMLTRNHQSRIFQQLAIPDILKKVLTGLSVTYQLQGDLSARATTASSIASRISSSPAGSWRKRGSSISSRTATALTRWWSPTRPRAIPTCPARPR